MTDFDGLIRDLEFAVEEITKTPSSRTKNRRYNAARIALFDAIRELQDKIRELTTKLAVERSANATTRRSARNTGYGNEHH